MDTSSFVKRPTRSDGSDHVHREKVALQYKLSARNKGKLKIMLGLPFISAFAVFCHILQKEMNMQIINQVLPSVEIWEYFFMSSPILSIIGWMSLKKNRANLLTFYIFASIIFNICPLLFAAYVHAPELGRLIFQKHTKMFLFGKPFSALLYMFLGWTLAITVYAVHMASRLVKAWNTKGYKSKWRLINITPI